MKIYINLLPPETKEEIKKNKRFRIIVWQEFILFFIMLVFITLIASTNFILKIQLDSLNELYAEEQSRESYIELQKYEDEFKKINSEVSLLHKIKGKNIYWLNVLDKLNSLVEDKIIFTDLTTRDYLVSIVGRAESRNDLLDFQRRLESEDCFHGVNVPISNLVVKENVDFQMDLSVEEECLKRN